MKKNRNINPEICKLLRETRKSKNLSLYKVAHDVGISPSYLCRIEKAKRTGVNFSTLVALIKYYDLDINQIINLL